MGVIAEMADDVVVMYLGRVVETGPVDDIFHAPQHPYTRALLRSIPSVHGQAAHAAADHRGLDPAPVHTPARAARSIPRCAEVMPGDASCEPPRRRRVETSRSR